MLKGKARLVVFLMTFFLANFLAIGILRTRLSNAQSQYPQPILYTVTVDTANLRLCARMDCKIVGAFSQGTEFLAANTVEGDVISGNKLWRRLFYNQQEAYIHSALTKEVFSNPDCTYLIVYEDKAYAYQTTSYRGTPLETYTRGDFVCQVGQEGNWQLIDLIITTQQVDKAYISAGTVTVFDGTLPNASIVDLVNEPITPPGIGIANPG